MADLPTVENEPAPAVEALLGPGALQPGLGLVGTLLGAVNTAACLIDPSDRIHGWNAKHEEFLKFREILGMMEQRFHLSLEGLRRIALVQQTMNHRKPSRFLESSEAIRQPTLLDGRVEEMVLPPRRRGEAEERNSLSGE